MDVKNVLRVFIHCTLLTFLTFFFTFPALLFLKKLGNWNKHIKQEITVTFSLLCNKVDKRYRPINIVRQH